MKLSFSLPSKPSSSPNPIPKPSTIFNNNDGDSIQYVNEFDASKPLGSHTKTRVIPPIPNQWLKSPEFENRFGVESLSTEIYKGLNLRQKPDTENEDGDELPRSAGVDSETLAIQKLKDDLERLPEHRGAEEYDDIAVEGFGAALLAGYGWRPGKGIGKNAKKEDVKGVEYHKRTSDRQGLGFNTVRGS